MIPGRGQVLSPFLGRAEKHFHGSSDGEKVPQKKKKPETLNPTRQLGQELRGWLPFCWHLLGFIGVRVYGLWGL